MPTWKKIIDNNLREEYERKADKARGVYLLYSAEFPYLPFDFAYSLYEISKKYGIPVKSLETQIRRGSSSRMYLNHFSLCYVNLCDMPFELTVNIAHGVRSDAESEGMSLPPVGGS